MVHRRQLTSDMGITNGTLPAKKLATNITIDNNVRNVDSCMMTTV